MKTYSESAAGLMPILARIWECSDWSVDRAKDLVSAIEKSILYQPGVWPPKRALAVWNEISRTLGLHLPICIKRFRHVVP